LCRGTKFFLPNNPSEKGKPILFCGKEGKKGGVNGTGKERKKGVRPGNAARRGGGKKGEPLFTGKVREKKIVYMHYKGRPRDHSLQGEGIRAGGFVATHQSFQERKTITGEGKKTRN